MRVLEVLEVHLAQNAYLAGDRFSIAEINFIPGQFALRLSKQDDPFTAFPHVAEWAERIAARPAWKVMGMIKWW